MRPYQAVMLFCLACTALVLAAQHQHAVQACALIDQALAEQVDD